MKYIETANTNTMIRRIEKLASWLDDNGIAKKAEIVNDKIRLWIDTKGRETEIIRKVDSMVFFDAIYSI